MRPTRRRALVLAFLGGLLWSSQRWWRARTAAPGNVDPATPWPPVPVEPEPLGLPAGDVGDLGGSAPVDGGCPDGHPVKAKVRSRIYHLPGMALYDRTIPDRCYSSGEEAERHGFRRARR